MELTSKSHLTILIIVIIAIIAIAFVMFLSRSQTQEERDEMRPRYIGIAFISIIVAVLIYFLADANSREKKSLTMEDSEGRPEYGLREAWQEKRAQWKAASDAKKEAKAAGLSDEQVRAAERKAKSDFRQVKKAGQNAAQAARDAERAKLGMGQKPAAAGAAAKPGAVSF